MKLEEIVMIWALSVSVAWGWCATETQKGVGDVLGNVAMSGEAVDVDNVRKECTLRLVEEHPEITDYPSQIEAIIACMDEKGGSDNVDAHH